MPVWGYAWLSIPNYKLILIIYIIWFVAMKTIHAPQFPLTNKHFQETMEVHWAIEKVCIYSWHSSLIGFGSHFKGRQHWAIEKVCIYSWHSSLIGFGSHFKGRQLLSKRLCLFSPLKVVLLLKARMGFSVKETGKKLYAFPFYILKQLSSHFKPLIRCYKMLKLVNTIMLKLVNTICDTKQTIKQY